MPDQVIVIQGATSTVVSSSPVSPVIVTGGGASAYQIWLEQGNAGTEADFLESLEGAQGPQGATGATGATGAQGPKGDNGDPGDDAPVQTLSIDGNELTLSDGGGTVTLPGGASDALGTGFTGGGGSGTIPNNTTAARGANKLKFGGSDLDGVDDFIGFFQDGDNAYGSGYNGNGDGEYFVTSRFQTYPYGSVYNISTYGLYTAAFNQDTGEQAALTLNSSGLNVDAPLSAFTGAVQVGQFSNAAAPNNTIFYSTTDSKLSYKDPGGTVHGLY